MFPGTFVAGTPDKPAVIRPATGEQLTYRQLDERSLRLARYLRAIGMRPGDHLAVVAGNDLRMLEVYWAALRSGLYITAVNWHLTPAEAAYVVDDCEASALVVSADAAAALPADPTELRRCAADWCSGNGRRLRRLRGGARAAVGRTAGIPAARAGHAVLVGHHRPAQGDQTAAAEGQVHETVDPYTAVFAPMYGFDADTVYLCRHRCITLRHCASAARSTPSAGP